MGLTCLTGTTAAMASSLTALLPSHLLAAVTFGNYINGLKAIPLLVLMFAWARLLTWADKDTEIARLPRQVLGGSMVGGFAIAAILYFFMPNWGIATAVYLLVFLLEVGVYLIMRNQTIGLKDLKVEIANALKGMTTRKDRAVAEVVNQVQFFSRTGDILPAPDGESPERPAFEVLQSALFDPLVKGAEQVDFTASSKAVDVKYLVDGVGYKGVPVDGAIGGEAVKLLKSYAGMDIADRRKPQTGKVRVSAGGKRHELAVQTAGTTAGESMRLNVDANTRHNWRLEDAGFTVDQIKTIKESQSSGRGIVLVAAPKGAGLTSLLYELLRSHDAFIEHIHTIEHDAPLDLEGITQNKLPAKPTPGEEVRLASWISSQEPDVLMISRVEDPATARELIAFAKKGKRVYIGMRAGSTIDALTQWRKLVGDDRLAMSDLALVVAGRTLRVLCTACKVAFTPDASQLRKLNIQPDAAEQLYQARAEPMRNDKGQIIPCDFCHELRYRGRRGFFEIFVIDDEVRAVVAAGGSVNQLKQSFRKQRGRYLQEMALHVVEQGETSVQEVLRVLKADSGSAAPTGPSAPAPVSAAV